MRGFDCERRTDRRQTGRQGRVGGLNRSTSGAVTVVDAVVVK